MADQKTFNFLLFITLMNKYENDLISDQIIYFWSWQSY
jgi:hypothetical protein